MPSHDQSNDSSLVLLLLLSRSSNYLAFVHCFSSLPPSSCLDWHHRSLKSLYSNTTTVTTLSLQSIFPNDHATHIKARHAYINQGRLRQPIPNSSGQPISPSFPPVRTPSPNVHPRPRSPFSKRNKTRYPRRYLQKRSLHRYSSSIVRYITKRASYHFKSANLRS